MKNIIKILPFLILFTACQQKIEPSDIANLNGYWEIEKAVMPDGNKKEYKINETIDYFQVKDNQGFRKKVMPQLDGKYLTNNQVETIKIIEKDNKTYIAYSTDFAKWNEQIVELTKDKLTLKTEHNLEYHYKRQIPFSIK